MAAIAVPPLVASSVVPVRVWVASWVTVGAAFTPLTVRVIVAAALSAVPSLVR